ncbi:MAG: DEAD/DEAH box helicase family protein, partial [Ghiorsea sp.]
MNEGRQSVQVVRVAVFAPLWTCFDYLWSAELGFPEQGVRVQLPFGHGQRVGVVLACVNVEDRSKLKSVLDRLDEQPCFDAARCRWLERAAAYYLYPQGEMWELALSWAAHGEKRRFRCLDANHLSAIDADLGLAFKTKAAISLTTISKRCQKEAPKWRTFQALRQGLLEEVVKQADPFTTVPTKPITLRATQQQAVDQIQAHHDSFYPLLLFGCTGSGKTEVYLQAAAKCIAAGKSVLVLVPEIGLTPMWKQRLAERFEHIGIWHSGMRSSEKNIVRHHLAQTHILLGTRSALFLPLTNLGLIVIDEEHDSSFKQQDGVA